MTSFSPYLQKCRGRKCSPMIYILSGDKKGDTYAFIFDVIKYKFDQHCPIDNGSVLIELLILRKQ